MVSLILIGSIVGIVVLIVIVFIYYYNRFIFLENDINRSFANMDVQLKKRADLVPGLVNVVKGYAKHEKKVFEEVTKARTEMLKGNNIQDRVKSGNQLQEALKSIFAIAEDYPELKANENFLHFQQELSTIEETIANERTHCNNTILAYDNATQVFPGVFFFNIYGRKRKNYIKIPESEKEMPDIDV